MYILTYPKLELFFEKKLRAEQIDAINFSPNGQILALGSWDQVRARRHARRDYDQQQRAADAHVFRTQMVELVDMETRASIALKVRRRAKGRSVASIANCTRALSLPAGPHVIRDAPDLLRRQQVPVHQLARL